MEDLRHALDAGERDVEAVDARRAFILATIALAGPPIWLTPKPALKAAGSGCRTAGWAGHHGSFAPARGNQFVPSGRCYLRCRSARPQQARDEKC
jgi:hypothetical protein